VICGGVRLASGVPSAGATRVQEKTRKLVEGETAMKTKTHVKAGGINGNHNETLAKGKGLKVRTNLC
jgi:hypothetical protein